MSKATHVNESWGRCAAAALLPLIWAVGCGNGFRPSDCVSERPCSELAESGEEAERPAPLRVVSLTPEPGSRAAEPDTRLVIQLSEALAPATVTSERVQLLDGDRPVPGSLRNEHDVITFVPDAPLRLSASYRVFLSEEVTSEAGSQLATPLHSTFSVRDGAWHTVNLPGRLAGLAAASPLTANGATLLAWTGSDAEACSVSAAWLEPGSMQARLTPFARAASDCGEPAVAAGKNGTGVVTWSEGGPSYVRQYRSGAWEGRAAQATESSQSWVTALAVSPLGAVSRFERSVRAPGVTVQTTDAEGAWQAGRYELATSGIWVLSDLSVGFDEGGNGLAAFTAWDADTERTQVMVSRYEAARGDWASAQVVPGSATASDASFGAVGGAAIAVAPGGDALVVWRAGETVGWLKGSYFHPDQGWSSAQPASPTPSVLQTKYDAASVTYDGSHFVTAWLEESEGHMTQANTARYEPARGWSWPETHAAGRSLPRVEHPRLVSDGHGALLLLWQALNGNVHTALQRRFVAGAWGAVELLPSYASPREAALPVPTMNDRGLASLAWAVEEAPNERVAIRVARFF